MCSFMTKPSHSGLMYHLSLLPQTLYSSHTAPSPHLLAFLCAASSSKNVLWLFPPFALSQAIFACLIFTHISGARSGLSFPEKPSLTPSSGLRWYSTWAHAHPGTPTPKRHCLFLHRTHLFLCQVSGEALSIWCLLEETVDEIHKKSLEYEVSTLKEIFLSFSSWMYR